LHAARHPVGGFHRDGAHAVFPEVLLHFGNDIDLPETAAAIRHDSNRVVDFRQAARGEFDVHHWADHLDDFAGSLCGCCCCHSLFLAASQT
jgi:hypothetical protein